MTDMTNPSQDDLWLEQQLAEAHALLGDVAAQPEAVPEIEPEDFITAPPQSEREPVRHTSPVEKKPNPKKKDRVVPILVGIIVAELLAIAGVALYWVNILA